ncbi:MFS general substrate transporter [Acaromyces ingoldii]|uniref:MFS general substrate transporter n=1 Tax=Acaromyces ingoldii TaxID=215250 RepID=A0A316YRB1_9BASI|nr:MFS general substrate transporter [Acaromyces ingoldii]PWN91771.1 MFS general substrate transporter [Acaromyces ingoldii]
MTTSGQVSFVLSSAAEAGSSHSSSSSASSSQKSSPLQSTPPWQGRDGEMPALSFAVDLEKGLSKTASTHSLPPLPSKSHTPSRTPLPESLEPGTDPLEWPEWYKAWANTTYCLLILCTTYSSSAFAPSAKQVQHAFNVDYHVAICGTSLYVLGFALGPLLFGPLSELQGRKVVYVGAFILLTAFNLGACLAPNIELLLIFRLLGGICGSSALNNVASSIVDMTRVRNRLRYNVAYRLVSFGGPTLGPLVATFITEEVGWRWNLRTLPIFSAVVLALYAFTVPESHRATLLRRQRRRRGEKEFGEDGKQMPSLSISQRYAIALKRPFVFMFTEPVIIIVGLYTALLYGLLYGTLAAFPVVWQEIRGRSPEYASLTYLSILGGFTLGALIIGCFLQDWQFKRAYDEHRYVPETRIGPATWAGFAVPLGLFLFAWTAPYDALVGPVDVHYIIPCFALIIFAFGMQVVFNSWLSYAADSYGASSASAMAACTFSRSLLGAAFPLFMSDVINKTSVQATFTFLGCLSLILSFGSIAFVRYGHMLRAKSRFATDPE